MNLNIDNSNLKISQNNNLTAKSVNLSSSKSAIVPMTDAEKSALLKKLGITLDQYNLIKAQHPNFDQLPLGEQLEIVKTPIAQNQELQSSEVKEEETTSEPAGTKKTSDVKTEYNKKDVKGKIDDCYSELAKNIYIYGAKDKDKVIAEAHSKEEWNKLSDADKKELVNKIKTKIDERPELKQVKDIFLSDANNADKENYADTVMRGLLAADQEGISYISLIQSYSEAERARIIEDYLLNTDESKKNDNDKLYEAEFKLIKSEIADEAGISVDCLDAEEVSRRVRYCNLNKNELLYKALEKKGQKRSNIENKKYAQLKQSYSSKEYKDNINFVLQKSKARKLMSLKEELNNYNELIKAGKTLTAEQDSNKQSIEKYLQTTEAKNLEKIELPEPQTPKEKLMVEKLKALKENVAKHINSNAQDIEETTVNIFIAKETKGMSEKAKRDFYATFFKFYDSDGSVDILQKTMQDGKNQKLANDLSKEKDLTPEFAMIAGSLTENQNMNVQANIREQIHSKNHAEKQRGEAGFFILVNSYTSEACNDEKFDGCKVNLTDIALSTKDVQKHNRSIDVTKTIQNENKRQDNYKNILTHQNTTSETGNYAIDNIDNSKDGLVIVENASDRWSACTKHAAEKTDLMKKLGDEAPKACQILHKNINKHFEGKDAIKYSNALSDQIQYCDKNNQLAMHNEMMTSKYSEVQQHVAGNIKNYDPTVQADALSTVYRSGNEKAIATAVNDVLPAIKSPDAQQIALKQAVMELAGIADDSEIQAKFANGTLSKAEIAQLSSSERRDYYVKLFDSATPAEKIKYLKSIPNGRSRQTVYNLIGTYYKNTFKSLIESDVSTAEAMFNMGLKADLQNIICETIMFKAETNPSFKFLRDRLNLNNTKDFASAETESVTAKTINNFSVPMGINIKEILKKDKNGSILA